MELSKEENRAVLSPTNRFPVSSTPAVSIDKGKTTSSKSLAKENSKQTLSSFFKTKSNCVSRIVMSPIHSSEGQLQETTTHFGGSTRSGLSNIMEVTAYDKVAVAKDAVFSNNISAIQKLRILQLIREGKRVDAEPSLYYKFKRLRETFRRQNTEAAFHAFYLLLEMYDPTEAKTRFRDVWPIHDKKTEGLFRRVVSIWLKEIIPKHSEFFGSFKIETLGGLLVNAYGDRFYNFLESLTNMVLQVVNTNSLPKEFGRVLRKQQDFKIQSLTLRQLLVLTSRTKVLMDDAAARRNEMLKKSIASKIIQKRSAARYDKLKEDIKHQTDVLSNERKLFQELVKEGGKPLDMEATHSASTHYLNSLAPGVHVQQATFDQRSENLRDVNTFYGMQCQEIMQCVEEVEGFLDQFDILWSLPTLGDPPQKSKLDVNKLFVKGSWEGDTLNGFIATVESVSKDLCRDERLQQPVPENLLKRFKEVQLKLALLEIQQGELLKTKNDEAIKQMELLSKCPTPTENNNWKMLCSLELPTLDFHSLLAPPKKIDCAAKTGYTPKLLNFLEPGFRNKDRGQNNKPNMGAMASKYYAQPVSSPVSRKLVPKESKIRLKTEMQSPKSEQLSLEENCMDSTSSSSTLLSLDCDIQKRLEKIMNSLSSSSFEETKIGEVTTLVVASTSKLSVSGNSKHESKDMTRRTRRSSFLENIQSEKLEEEKGIMEVSYCTLFSADNSDDESDC